MENSNNLRQQEFSFANWFLPIVVSLYVFMRWYKGEPILRTILIVSIPIILTVVSQESKDREEHMFSFPVTTVVLVAADYIVGIFYSPYTLGQKTFIPLLLFSFVAAFYFSFDTDASIKTFKILKFMALVSCLGIVLQFIVPNLIDIINRFVLQPQAYKMVRVTNYRGYITGINGYSYMSGIFALILFGYHLINVLISNNKNERVKIIDMVMLSLGAVSAIMTQKRSMLVCLIVSALFMLVLFLKNKPELLGKVFLVLVFATVLIAVILTKTSYGMNIISRFTEVEDVSSGRFDIYNELLSNIDESIIFGKGTGSFNELYNSGAHNVYLQLLYENGLIGLILWVILFINTFVTACKGALRTKNFAFNYLNVFIQCVFIVYAFFGNPLYNNALILLYFTTVGYTYSVLDDSKEESEESEENRNDYIPSGA